MPESLLFPGLDLPLYVFEPRYREMVRDCYRTHKIMAVSLFRPGWQGCQEPIPCYDVVGVGYIRVLVENRDGTFSMVLKGIGRAKIVRYVRDSPYRVARIRLLPDQVDDPNETQRLCRKLRRLVAQKTRLTSENPAHPVNFPQEYEDPFVLSYIAACMLNIDYGLKQDLLETLNCNYRLKHLIDLFQEEIFPHGTRN